MPDPSKFCFLPAGSSDPRLLILGSLPGEASLLARRYYAHPQNQFWRLLGDAIGEPLAGIGYAARIERLAERGILLWDVVGEASRIGSLDTALRDVRPNQLPALIATCPSLIGVAFNGGTAARIGRRALDGSTRVQLIELPSSSPAFTRPYAEKLARWSVLGPLALPAKGATLGS